MEAGEDTKLSCLCSHYKDSFDIQAAAIKQRDLLFYVLLVVAAIFSLQITSIGFVNEVLSKYISKSIDVQLDKKPDLLSSMVWFVLFGVSSKYFQIVVQIEKSYDYIHKIEEEINRYYSGTPCFTREGASYLSDYPLFSNWVWALYTIVFPLLLLFSIWKKIMVEIWSSSSEYNLLNINFIFYVITGTSTVLYLVKMHKKALLELWSKWAGRVHLVRKNKKGHAVGKAGQPEGAPKS